ncbi:Esterase TesA [Zhongshania aliphaticivorans]|uniref:Esterase TesA n=2 Tax=Zhongshania aliphaticivorans TaxID=1470434 RepID=A0A5S9NCP5_9GAMM|nr:Esterase TesA [Zhongshania aliphaticivorans]CAA0115322.1 Esterase TesA [Zhongshania aliphaticivorans]CAA0120150.1 Esterase TesA [Zhongshania aliphaticivorans]
MKKNSLSWSQGLHLLRNKLVAYSVFSLIILASTPFSYGSTDPKILVLGDSLSAAYGIAQKEGWVNLLKSQVSSDTTIINASISGETTAGGLQRLPTLLKEHQPDIVVIELGGNDGLRGYPILSIRNNLKQMITTSTQTGAQVLLLGMKIPPNYGKRYTQAFEQNYTVLADELDLPLIPFLLESIAGNTSLMQKDGIHPTAEAQPIIVQNVLPMLREMLD